MFHMSLLLSFVWSRMRIVFCWLFYCCPLCSCGQRLFWTKPAHQNGEQPCGRAELTCHKAPGQHWFAGPHMLLLLWLLYSLKCKYVMANQCAGYERRKKEVKWKTAFDWTHTCSACTHIVTKRLKKKAHEAREVSLVTLSDSTQICWKCCNLLQSYYLNLSPCNAAFIWNPTDSKPDTILVNWRPLGWK